jgi:hypothetical protein
MTDASLTPLAVSLRSMSPKEAEFVLELLDGFLVVPREKVNEDERDYLNR